MSKTPNSDCPECGNCLCNEGGGVLNPEDGLYYHAKCLVRKKEREAKASKDPNTAVVTDKKV